MERLFSVPQELNLCMCLRVRIATDQKNFENLKFLFQKIDNITFIKVNIQNL